MLRESRASGRAEGKEKMAEPGDGRHRELAGKLHAMLERAPVGRASTIHHLFGILYADEMSGMRLYELAYIAELGGSKQSMGREIGRGRNLAEYVEIKAEYRSWA